MSSNKNQQIKSRISNRNNTFKNYSLSKRTKVIEESENMKNNINKFLYHQSIVN
jgi:hypothetical protein